MYTAKEIKEGLLISPKLEPLRRWKRRLIVALTDEEKQKCKAKIKEYERKT
jgi:hypothetical protein